MTIENDNSPDTPAEDTPSTSESILDAINEAVSGDVDLEADDAPDSEGSDTPAETAAQPAAETPAPAEPSATPAAPQPAAAKPAEPDAVNDPIPEEIKGRTRERMETLITTAKTLTSERDTVRAERDEIMGYIAETRATPEQYTQALGYLKAVNSGDPVQIREAIKTVQAELNALSSLIGEPVAGVDLLTRHQDLRAAVENGDMSPQYAEELAAARNMRLQREQGAQQVSEQQRAQQVVNQGKEALNQLEKQYTATDPNYAAKRAVLIPMLRPILSQLPPAQWASAFKQAYDSMPAPAPVTAPVAAAPAVPAAAPQPLRARQPAGGAAKVPTNTMDAIELGLEQAARR